MKGVNILNPPLSQKILPPTLNRMKKYNPPSSLPPTLHFPTVPNIYLFLQILDLNPLVVELVTLLPHSLQQICNAPLLAVDHLLIREGSYLIVIIIHTTQSLY